MPSPLLSKAQTAAQLGDALGRGAGQPSIDIDFDRDVVDATGERRGVDILVADGQVLQADQTILTVHPDLAIGRHEDLYRGGGRVGLLFT